IVCLFELMSLSSNPGPIERFFACNEPITNACFSNHGCSSACFLIWVAGIDRRGDALAIHRPRFHPVYFAGLSAKDADEKYREMLGDVRDYMIRMDVPGHYFNSMLAISSDEIEILDTNRVKEDLSKYIPSIEEWIIARCGSDLTEAEAAALIRLLTKRNESQNLTADEEAYLDPLYKRTEDYYGCVNRSLRAEREKAYKMYF
ncbi:MAG: hypothetical protein MN733_00540, partial [Nitrososphaera sp.]|nr:hypothetical protein [Nitrososphaera sp.]